MAGLDTAALRLEDEVVLDVVVISLLVVVVELVVAVVEEVVILTGFALLGGLWHTNTRNCDISCAYFNITE